MYNNFSIGKVSNRLSRVSMEAAEKASWDLANNWLIVDFYALIEYLLIAIGCGNWRPRKGNWRSGRRDRLRSAIAALPGKLQKGCLSLC